MGKSVGMRKWVLASAAIVAALVLMSRCTSATTPSSTAVDLPRTTLPQSTTTTTVPEIIPGVASVRYDNSQLGFSLFRPETSTVETQGFEAYLPLTQTPVAAMALPKDLFKGTNLMEAGVYIGASSSPAMATKWNLPSADSTEVPAGALVISGVSFAAFTSTEAAAGNVYEEKVYRVLRDDTCFEIVELLHSGNIDNYPAGVVEFDKGTFQGYLAAIVRTFSFGGPTG
jgi:hypothetical protein